jgi:hypothetical protein
LKIGIIYKIIMILNNMKKKYFALTFIVLFFALNVVSVEEVSSAGVVNCTYNVSPGYTAMGGTTCSSLGLDTTYATEYGDGWVYCDDFSDWSSNKPNRTCTAPSPAPDPVNGSCGGSRDTCSTGTFSDGTDTTDEYRWSCSGSNEGTSASCSSAKPCTYAASVTTWGSCTAEGNQGADSVEWATKSNYSPSSQSCINLSVPTTRSCNTDGTCGSADESNGGEYTATSPTSELCDDGDASAVTGNSSDGYSWTCDGINGSPDSCNTPAAECSNGVDDDVDGIYDTDDLDCGGDSSSNNESGFNEATLLCTFFPDRMNYDTEDITATAYVSGSGINYGDMTFEWTGDFGSGGGRYKTKYFDTPGEYEASVTASHDGINIGPVTCEVPSTGGNVFVSGSATTTFNIPIGLADSIGECDANYTIAAGAAVSCDIVTDQGEPIGDTIVSDGSEEIDEDIKLNVGNDYRLECTMDDGSGLELEPTNFYECRKPSISET